MSHVSRKLASGSTGYSYAILGIGSQNGSLAISLATPSTKATRRAWYTCDEMENSRKSHYSDLHGSLYERRKGKPHILTKSIKVDPRVGVMFQGNFFLGGLKS